MHAAARGAVATCRGRLRPLELVALGALLCALLPGLALTALSPTAWPVPAVAAVGVLLLLVKAALAPATPEAEGDAVATEAAVGVTQIEAWLSQRHHT